MKLKKCRICNGNSLTDYLNLGLTPAADAFIKVELKSLNDPVYPLEVCLCDDCGISQLNYTVDPKILFQNDYPYESSTTKTGRLHFDQFGESVMKKAELSSDDLVIDVGSNVGVLLGAYQKRGCKVLGIEPSKHIAASANENGVETINDFISLPGSIDAIYANAGIGSPDELSSGSASVMNKILSVNILGVTNTVMPFIPHLKAINRFLAIFDHASAVYWYPKIPVKQWLMHYRGCRNEPKCS